MFEEIVDIYLNNRVFLGYKPFSIYNNGSTALGYSDSISDVDLTIIWQEEYPKASMRRKALKNVGMLFTEVSDLDFKALDCIKYNGISVNISHRIDYDVFNIYNMAKRYFVNNFNYYTLGGIQTCKVLYDYRNRLERYKCSLHITAPIKSNFVKHRKDYFEEECENVLSAATRGHIMPYIKSVSDVLETTAIFYYLSNTMFPSLPKWLLKDAERYNLKGEFLDLIKHLDDKIALNDASLIVDICKKTIFS